MWLRHQWTHAFDGKLRIHVTWASFVCLTVIVVTVIATNPSDWWDHAMETIDGTNEVCREKMISARSEPAGVGGTLCIRLLHYHLGFASHSAGLVAQTHNGSCV